MKKRICLLLPLLLLLSGCNRDAAQLTVVTGIGVDGQPGSYQIGAEVIQLSVSEQGNKSVFLSMDGRSITDGIDSMVSMTGRSLYCNHTQVLVIGRETAEAGLGDPLEELLRGTQYPISLRIAVAKGSAAEVMRAKPVVSDLHSVELESTIKRSAAESLAPDMDICRFYQDVYAPGIEGVLPFLELRENEGEQVCTLAGTALFRGPQMLTVLEREDSKRLMWLRGQNGGTLITEHAMLEITHLERKLEATPEGGTLHLKLTLKAGDGENNREQLMREAEEAMKQQCESLLNKLRKLQCDAVGFGNRLYQIDKQAWDGVKDRWPEIFSSYPVEVKVTVENMIWGRIWSTEAEGGSHGS